MPDDDKPPPVPPPHPEGGVDMEDFALELWRLKEASGLTLSMLRGFNTKTSSDRVKGKSFPPREFVEAFVVKCLEYGMKQGRFTVVDVNVELGYWRAAHDQIERAKFRQRRRARSKEASASEPESTEQEQADSFNPESGSDDRIARATEEFLTRISNKVDNIKASFSYLDNDTKDAAGIAGTVAGAALMGKIVNKLLARKNPSATSSPPATPRLPPPLIPPGNERHKQQKKDAPQASRIAMSTEASCAK